MRCIFSTWFILILADLVLGWAPFDESRSSISRNEKFYRRAIDPEDFLDVKLYRRKMSAKKGQGPSGFAAASRVTIPPARANTPPPPRISTPPLPPVDASTLARANTWPLRGNAQDLLRANTQPLQKPERWPSRVNTPPAPPLSLSGLNPPPASRPNTPPSPRSPTVSWRSDSLPLSEANTAESRAGTPPPRSSTSSSRGGSPSGGSRSSSPGTPENRGVPLPAPWAPARRPLLPIGPDGPVWPGWPGPDQGWPGPDQHLK